MDNQATESGALTVDSAADAFSALLSAPDQAIPEPSVDTDIEEKEKKPEEPHQAEEVSGKPEAEQMITIKVDGKEIEVPLSELKNGYQRQSDYTKKTMEVAEQRKAAEQQAAQAAQERNAYSQNLQKMQVQLEVALGEQQKIDWQALIDSDPHEYLKQQHLAQQRQAQLNQNYSEQQRIAAINQAEQRQSFESHLKHQQEELLAKLPVWKDEAKAKAEKAALRDYLLEQGYDAQTVSNVADAKAVLLARKAMLYDQMVGKANAAAKKVQSIPKVERPGAGATPVMDKRSAAFQRLGKTGRVEDAAAVFAQFI